MNIKRFFSFDWLLNPNKELRNQVNELIQEIKKKNEIPPVPTIGRILERKPYNNLYFSGNSITVITEEGEVLSSECDLEKYTRIKESKTKEEILSLLYPKENKKEEYVIAKNDLAILEVNSDFEVVGTKVYLKPCKLEIPEIVKATFIEILEKKLAVSSRFNWSKATNDEDLDYLEQQYQSLKMFWYKLATNSIEKCRESVLKFCKDNDVKISRLGSIIAYRNVVTHKTTKNSLNQYLKSALKKYRDSNNYYLLKHKETDLYSVIHKYTNKKLFPKDYIVLGKLNSIVPKNNDETIYTSWHNKGKYTFKIGDVYKMVDEDPNPNVGNCSTGGLHGAACDWDYSGFGDTKVVVLINPSKTIFTPSSDSGKFRCSEMKIACLNPNNYGEHIDYELIRQADKEYNDYTIEQLQNIVKSKDFSSLSVQENVPLLSLPDLKDIVNVLQNKVVKI